MNAKLIQREPTPEMMQAAWDAANALHNTPEGDDPLPGHQFRAMWDAAPQVDGVPDGLFDRIEAAQQRIKSGHAPRRIPADPTDIDLVLHEIVCFLKGEPPPFWIKAAAPQPAEQEPDYHSAFKSICADMSAISALLGFDDYPGVDAVLRAITEAKLAAQEQEKDAARYRWLAERFTGFDMDWGRDEEAGELGKYVLVFAAPDGFRVSRDIGSCIDAALSAQSAGEKDE